MLRQILATTGLSLAALFAVSGAAHAGEAGRIIYVTGSAQVAERAAVLNAPVQEGEMLVTGKDGYIYIQTADGGLFILRPSTKARIATYYIDKKDPANTRVKLELLSGVARSQSGEAVKLARQNFRFNTPVAAIGIRGTDFVVSADQDTTRVTVLSGGVTLSGFGGGCRPDGAGPCEGGAARELSAAQKGLLLQYRRGQAAPQLVPETSAVTPDLIAPPRADEPAKQGGGAAALPVQPSLDAQKTANLQQKIIANENKPVTEESNKPIETVPPITEVNPTPVVPPVVTQPVEPPVPERRIVWGRWQPLANLPVVVNYVAEFTKGSQRVAQNDDYALFRTSDAREYVVPERGEIGFSLAIGEATIRTDNNPAIAPVQATMENGTLKFNFDQRTFATSIDLVSKDEKVVLQSTGKVATDGLFVGDALYIEPNNMRVSGILSNASGGSAAYLFNAPLSNSRSVNGITYWNNPVAPK
jgi:hypothetical protein